MGSPEVESFTRPEVWSSEGGKYEMTQELRDIACFTSDHVLHISPTHSNNMHVLGYMARLDRHSVHYRVADASLQEIADLYEGKKATANGAEIEWDDSTTNAQERMMKILREATDLGASDVHFVIKDIYALVLYRIHGDLQRMHQLRREDALTLSAAAYNSMCDVGEMLFNPNKAQDARIKVDFLKRCGLIGGRIATRPSDVGLLVVIRLLRPRKETLTLDQLGYAPEQIEQILYMGRRTHGINIISGATGSGKSTTLELLLGSLAEDNNFRLNIITAEDPPEYQIKGVVQTPIICDRNDHEAVSREWARAITNMMRLDPDVIMVGEVRDLGSAVAAIRAAMTGHGVWGTLHANDPVSILERLRDLGVDINQITDPGTVTGLINQSLVRVLCPNCKRPYEQHKDELDSGLITRIERTCNTKDVCLAGDGCPTCGGFGVIGRTVVAEALVPTLGFMESFRKDGKARARAYWIKHMHGITKCAHLLRRINAGVVDPRHGERAVGPLDDDITVFGDDNV